MSYPNLLGEKKLLGPEMVQLTTDKVKVIKKRMKEAQDRQKKLRRSPKKALGIPSGG